MTQKNFIKKIILGTAQFGKKYGITNKAGSTQNHEIKKILKICKTKKIRLIDSAINYRKAEKKLGLNSLKDFKIITKIPSVPINKKDVKSWVVKITERTLKKLKQKHLHAVLVHDSSNLVGSQKNELYEAMCHLKKTGLTKKIGVSIYDFKEMKKIISEYKIDIVQVPFNILDRRILDKKLLNLLKRKKIEIHARSIFLQGLLLSNEYTRFKKFRKFKKLWNDIDKYCIKNKTNILNIALNYVLSKKQIKRVVIGFEDSKQLKQILVNIDNFKKKKNFNKLISRSELLINPSNWKKI
jgi:aryl-alcohol dehydrogenase-like predicted oxidoreductase